MMKKNEKKRVIWVDIAKALAILSIIFSHTLDLDMELRVILFSFHVPLFFILSGYTTTLAKDKKTFFKRLKKNFKYLIIPALAVLLIYSVATAFIPGRENYTDVAGFSSIIPNLKYTIYDFFFKAYPDSPANVTAIWFLIALFGAKTIMDFINITVKSEKNWLIFFILGFIGVLMGVYSRPIPCFVDMMFVAAMFIEIGIMYRKYERKIKKYTPILLLVALFYWFSQVMEGVHIEIFTRFYAGYWASILTAIAGSFIVCNFAIMLEEGAKKAGKLAKKVMGAVVTLGQNTLLLYLIHCLDIHSFGFLWDFRDGTREMMWASTVLRLMVNLVLFVMIYNGKRLLLARGPCSRR